MSGEKNQDGALDGRVLDELFAVIDSRKGGDPEASYTAKLLAGGVETIAAKITEEAAETVLAGGSEDGGSTIVSSPHKIYGPETNDLVLQLRKRGIDKVILGGMSANLCTESHMRELMEQGFEVAVVSDATAAAIVEEGNGYEAALINFRFIANTVWTTKEAVQRISSAK